MAGMTMSPQLRESPETAKFQEVAGRFCAASLQLTNRISPAMCRIRVTRMEADISAGSKLKAMKRREFGRALAAVATSAALAPKGSAAEGEVGSITDVQGLKVGHFTESRRPTGCTVLLFEKGATAGVDVRGFAPGTRETDLLNPIDTVQQVQAILLAGGSAFGLDAASGVVRFLEEHRLGYAVGEVVVPIVPAAILYDLEIGDPKIRPTAESGYKACQAATSQRVMEGNVGAGAGATIGTMVGRK